MIAASLFRCIQPSVSLDEPVFFEPLSDCLTYLFEQSRQIAVSWMGLDETDRTAYHV